MPQNIDLNQPAPDFSLNDTSSRPVRLSDYREKKKVVLVFNRGFICPFCQRNMEQLRRDYHQFVEQNAEVVVVGPDKQDAFVRCWKMYDIPFVGLSDPGHTVSGIYEQEVNWMKLGRMPAIFLVDLAGNIRYAHYGDSMADIPPNSELLSFLEQI